MILTVVGSGSLVPSARRSTPALALRMEGLQATVDGGTGTMRRQAELGLDYRETDVLFFTHIHPDHTLDLLHFLFAGKYTPSFTRSRPVRIMGPTGFGIFLDRLRDPILRWTDGGEAGLMVDELHDGETREVGPLRITVRELAHSVTNLGYRFTSERGGTVVFTGDTGFCEALVELAGGADVLVAECSGDAAHPAPGHLTAPEVGRLAARANVGQVVLTHLYPLPDDRARLPEVRAEYDGPVLLAEDGMRFLA